MRKCELCLEFKNVDCFYRCSARKDGRQGYCKKCCTIKTRERLSKHPEISRLQWLKRKGSIRYKEQRRKASEKYRKANKKKTNTAIAAWLSKNPDRHCAYQAMRRSKKAQAAPAWANKFFMEEAYDLAKRRTALMTGGHKWHVDHIVPLQSNLVCGLHVHNNLQVIPWKTNISKGNRHWPQMPQGE